MSAIGCYGVMDIKKPPAKTYPKTTQAIHMSESQKESLRFWGDVSFKVIATIAMTFAAWAGKTTFENAREISEIRSQSVTAKEHLSVWQAISATKEHIATLPSRADIADIEKTSRENREMLIEIRAAVTNRPNGG